MHVVSQRSNECNDVKRHHPRVVTPNVPPLQDGMVDGIVDIQDCDSDEL